MYPYEPDLDVIDPETQDAILGLYGWKDQARAGGWTADRPALAVAGPPTFVGSPPAERLCMVWRGERDNRNLSWSIYDGTNWSPERECGFASTHGPTLTSFGVGSGETAYFLAWKGARDDSGIYWAARMSWNSSWGNQIPLAGVGTSCSPSAVEYNGRIYLAWKGVNDIGVWYSVREAADSWTPQRRIGGAETRDSPCLISWADHLYLFWRGPDGDSRIRYSWLESPTADWQPARIVKCLIAKETSGTTWLEIASSHGPTATIRNNRIVLAWKGVEDGGLYFSPFDGNEWSGQINIPNRGTSAGPAIATWNDRLYMTWKGFDPDTTLWYSSLG
jgi:hypothetical protein